MKLRRVVAIISALGAATVLAGPAVAAPDTTGPVVTLPTYSSYVVGSTVENPTDTGDGSYIFSAEGAQFSSRWTAHDASGICGYSVDQVWLIDGVEPMTPFYATTSTTGEVRYNENGWSSSSARTGFNVNATDCAGNTSTTFTRAVGPTVLADVGKTTVGGWRQTFCACAIGSSTLNTSTRGASLSTQVAGAGKPVALVMAKGPARGKAAVYLDGVLVRTVDTYAPVNTNRVVVWSTTLVGSGTHTLKVVNLATSGRPRIDVDALLGAR